MSAQTFPPGGTADRPISIYVADGTTSSLTTAAVNIPAGYYSYELAQPASLNGTTTLYLDSASFTGSAGYMEFTSDVTGASFVNASLGQSYPLYNWTGYTSNTDTATKSNNGMHYGDGLYLIGSYRRISYSTDAITWTGTGNLFVSPNGYCYDLSSSSTAYVGVGSDGRIFSSTNGVSWTSRTSGVTTILFAVHHDYSHGFIAGGIGASYVTQSTDGITWTTRSTGAGNQTVQGITYGAGIYAFCTNNSGSIYTSTNGVSWTNRYVGLGSEIKDIAYSPEIGFLVAGVSNQLRTSTDAITWTSRNVPTGETKWKIAMNGRYAIIATTNAGGRYIVTTNGLSFAFGSTTGLDALDYYEAVYGDGKYLLGNNGTGGSLVYVSDWETVATEDDYALLRRGTPDEVEEYLDVFDAETVLKAPQFRVINFEAT